MGGNDGRSVHGFRESSYTVNGWKRFIARLTHNGVFTVSRWFHPEHPDEAARTLSLAMATLIEMGEPKPAEHLYFAANGRLSTLIVGHYTALDA